MSLLREWKKVLESDLDSVALELKDFLETPALVILTGEVGAGKTTFVKSFLRVAMGNKLTFSPSYSIINEIHPLIHGDFYRLQSSEEIIHLELEMYLEDKDFFFVEWAREYLSFLKSHIPDDFTFYELLFEMTPSLEGGEGATRHIQLEAL